MAAMIIAKNPEKFGFGSQSNPENLTQTQIITVDRSISLADLAVNIGVDSKVLGDLNPALRLGITPPSHVLKDNPFEITVPTSKYDLALDTLNSLPEAPQERMVQARIKTRESLQKFAVRYKLDINSLQKSNAGLHKKSFLKRGQMVNVPIVLGTGQYEKLFAVNKHKQKRKLKHIVRNKNKTKIKYRTVNNNKNKIKHRTVKNTKNQIKYKTAKTKIVPKKREAVAPTKAAQIQKIQDIKTQAAK